MGIKASSMHIQIKEVDANQLNQHLCRLKEHKKVTWACLYSWVHSHERSIHSSQMQASSGLEAKKASYWHFELIHQGQGTSPGTQPGADTTTQLWSQS